MLRARHSSRGFTLLEVLIALIMLGLLAFVLVPRMSGLRDVGVNQQAEQFRRDIARVQLLAISRAQRLRLNITASGYSAVTCTAPASCTGSALSDPQTGSALVVSLTGGATFSAASTLDFDTLGRPATSTGLLATATVFTLTGEGQVVRVEVLPLTGYARVLN